MRYPISNHELVAEFIKQGLVPDECVDVRLDIGGFDVPLQMTYTVNITEDQLVKIANAFTALKRREG